MSSAPYPGRSVPFVFSVRVVLFPERAPFRLRPSLDRFPARASRVSSPYRPDADSIDSGRDPLARSACSAFFPAKGDCITSGFRNRSGYYRGDLFSRVAPDTRFPLSQSGFEHRARFLRVRRLAHVRHPGTTSSRDVFPGARDGISPIPSWNGPSGSRISRTRKRMVGLVFPLTLKR
jgi:hypothetical protein